MLITVVDFDCCSVGTRIDSGEVPVHCAAFASDTSTGYGQVCSNVSLSGSRESAVKVTSRLELGVHVAELVPSGQGKLIEAHDDDTETVGGWFGGGGNPTALRCPIQNCASEAVRVFGLRSEACRIGCGQTDPKQYGRPADSRAAVGSTEIQTSDAGKRGCRRGRLPDCSGRHFPFDRENTELTSLQ